MSFENLIILGISGKLGSGKTTISDNIIKVLKNPTNTYFNLPISVDNIKFAKSLYDLKNIITNHFNSLDIDNDLIKKIKDDKTILQLLGSEWGRRIIDNDIWVKILYNNLSYINKINNVYNNKSIIIIDDLRFKNEFKMLKEIGAFTVRLKRASSAPEELIKGRDLNHESEIDLDNYEDQFDLIEYTAGNHTIEESTNIILSALNKYSIQ